MENMNRRERRRRGFRGGAAAAGNGGGGGGGFGGLNGGPARGGAPRTIRDDEQFAADDPDQEALLSAFADHCQLLPASEEDAREVARMNEGYRRAVAETADRDLLASGAAAGSSPSAPASVVRGELRDLLGRYLQYLTAGPREKAEYQNVLSVFDAVLQAGRVQLKRHVDSVRFYDSAGGFVSRPNADPNPALLPRYRAVAYGSFISGLCSPHGDIDVALELDEEWQHRPFNPTVVSSGTLKHLSREDKAELLTKFVNELTRAGVISERKQMILHARVPIAKVLHLGTGIKCDISVGGRDSNWKSAVVGEAIAAAARNKNDGGIKDTSGGASLVRLAKAWARAAGLADAASAGLNSFSITLLALFHLQMCGEVDSMRELMGLERADAEAEEPEKDESWGGGNGRNGTRSSPPYNRVLSHLSVPLPQRRPLAGGALQDNAEQALEMLRHSAAEARRRAAAVAAADASASSSSSPSSSSASMFRFLFPSSHPPPALPVPGAAFNPPSPSRSSGTPGDLLALLARFLSGLSFSMAHWRDSPRARARVRASVWNGEFAPGVWGKGYAAAVEDPADWADNTARALGCSQRDRVAAAAREGCEALLACCSLGDGETSPPDAREVFQRLFGIKALNLVTNGQGVRRGEGRGGGGAGGGGAGGGGGGGGGGRGAPAASQQQRASAQQQRPQQRQQQPAAAPAPQRNTAPRNQPQLSPPPPLPGYPPPPPKHQAQRQQGNRQQSYHAQQQLQQQQEPYQQGQEQQQGQQQQARPKRRRRPKPKAGAAGSNNDDSSSLAPAMANLRF